MFGKEKAPKENQPKEEAKAPKENKKVSEDFAPEESSSFVPEKGEEELYHVKLTKSVTVANQKVKTEEKVQKMKPKAFNQFRTNADKLGYEIEVLFAPEKD